MAWTYQIGFDGEDWGIYEVYFDGERITGVSSDSVVPTCESREEVRELMRVLLRASEKEPLNIAALGEGKVQPD